MGLDWDGWPFGRDLYVAEIFSLIQGVPGVQHVLDVQLFQRSLTPRLEMSSNGDERHREFEQGLTPVKQKVVRVPADSLLCSLDHEVKISELGEEYD